MSKETRQPVTARAVAFSDLWACADSLEKDTERSQREIDAHVSKEEYGHAQYEKGRAHAFALAALRVRRLIKAERQGDQRR